jgi:F-type H+-transporting ATPase subunit c
VNKFAKFALTFAFVALSTSAAMAQGAGTAPPTSLISLTGSFGAGLVVIGAAFGISKLAAAALEGMARQPEVAGNIQTAMIIAAALIEGFTFYALYICSTGV